MNRSYLPNFDKNLGLNVGSQSAFEGCQRKMMVDPNVCVYSL
jgi:hypothetical protein